jgi:hypothetical protein
MSAENTRPNPGNIINRVRSDIPPGYNTNNNNSSRNRRSSIGNYGSEDESQLDTLVCYISSVYFLLFGVAVAPGGPPHDLDIRDIDTYPSRKTSPPFTTTPPQEEAIRIEVRSRGVPGQILGSQAKRRRGCSTGRR